MLDDGTRQGLGGFPVIMYTLNYVARACMYPGFVDLQTLILLSTGRVVFVHRTVFNFYPGVCRRLKFEVAEAGP